MRTELLIAQLARQAGPVRALLPPKTLLARWAVVSTISIAAGIAWYGMRDDAGAQLVSPAFLLRTLIAVALAIVAAWHALSWSVPGSEPEGVGRLGPQIVLVAWASVLLWPLIDSAITARIAAVRWHPQCAAQLASVAVVPAVWMYWQIRRAAPYALGWTSMQAALAAAATGAVAVQWICGLAGAGHQLLWHVTPLFVATAVIGVVGRRALRRF